jgi:hypothetical protein
VLKRGNHPRNHPICTNAQNPIALAWREHHQNGGDVLSLNDSIMSALLKT